MSKIAIATHGKTTTVASLCPIVMKTSMEKFLAP